MTRKVYFEKEDINYDVLHHELTSQVPRCAGIGRDSQGYYIVLEDSATAADEVKAAQIANAHDPASKTPEQRLKDNILSIANSAVGVAITDLTAAQQRALLAVLLYRIGAIAPDGTIVLPSEWGIE